MQKKVKKLTLNRETVRTLKDGEVAQANGGTILSLPIICTLLICTLLGCE
jgi:hypothetical protein